MNDVITDVNGERDLKIPKGFMVLLTGTERWFIVKYARSSPFHAFMVSVYVLNVE